MAFYFFCVGFTRTLAITILTGTCGMMFKRGVETCPSADTVTKGVSKLIMIIPINIIFGNLAIAHLSQSDYVFIITGKVA